MMLHAENATTRTPMTMAFQISAGDSAALYTAAEMMSQMPAITFSQRDHVSDAIVSPMTARIATTMPVITLSFIMATVEYPKMNGAMMSQMPTRRFSVLPTRGLAPPLEAKLLSAILLCC